MADTSEAGLEQFELQCFQIVAQAGGARSCFLEAVDKAESGDFEGAEQLLIEGDESFRNAHEVHRVMLQNEAEGLGMPFRIIVLHAEDQLMSAEAFRIMAEKFIAVYRKMANNGKES